VPAPFLIRVNFSHDRCPFPKSRIPLPANKDHENEPTYEAKSLHGAQILLTG
jgi:hypothetical protein